MSAACTPSGNRGNVVNLLVGGEETGGRLALIHSIERRGCEPPLHRHRNEDEIVYVLDGAITFYIDGQPCQVHAGNCLILWRGGEHCYRVESGEAHLLTIVMPAGLEGYYVELGGPEATADIERLVTVAARYGVEITGPAIAPAGVSTRAGGELPHLERTGSARSSEYRDSE